MTTTQELIDWLARQSKMAQKEKCPKASMQLDVIAQRLRELQAQVDSLERHILGGAVREET